MILVGHEPPPTLVQIHKVISHHSLSWWHYIDNAWVVCTDESIAVWRKRIAGQLHDGGHLLLIALHPGEKSGLLPAQAWTWLNGHIH